MSYGFWYSRILTLSSRNQQIQSEVIVCNGRITHAYGEVLLSEVCLVFKVYGCSVERCLNLRKCDFHNRQVAHNSVSRRKVFLVVFLCEITK